MKPIAKHAEYYLQDGNVTFMVERRLFRVHRYFFERESEFFRNCFATSEECDGTDEKPYVLDIKSEDFAKFLWVWYNRHYRYEGQSRQTWLTILTLATRWGFISMRELAIHQLEHIAMGAVERIALYKEHKIDKRLLIPSYIELCKSPTLPSPDEADRLQLETVLRLAAARERALLRASEQGCPSPTSALLEDDELVTIINDVFEMDSATGEEQQEFEPAKDNRSEDSSGDWFFVDRPGTNGTNGMRSGSPFSFSTRPPKPATDKASADIALYTPVLNHTSIRLPRARARWVILAGM
ncbi:hypothetical protein EDC04DRAFT_1683113 [Pisolithus marmoratus]|nr:hypothetical protein EDC04DRAFT_1683113 [Pisolithus marmoratus]